MFIQMRATAAYEIWEDRLMGVSRWMRVEDKALSAMQTGTDAEAEMEEALGLTDAEFDEMGAGWNYDE